MSVREQPAQASRPANPLLDALTRPHLAQKLLEAELGSLTPDAQSTRWIDELLSDPRAALVDGAQAAGVRRLLDFGHPWALCVSPEDLDLFRRYRPRGSRRWAQRWTQVLGAGVAFAAVLAALPGIGPPLLTRPGPLALCVGLLAIGWALLTLMSALVGSQWTPRSLVLREAPAACALFAVLAALGHSVDGVPLLAAAGPLWVGGALSLWLEQ